VIADGKFFTCKIVLRVLLFVLLLTRSKAAEISVIDILVAYTPAAQAQIGLPMATQAELQVAEAN
jgi:hypothetical protein